MKEILVFAVLLLSGTVYGQAQNTKAQEDCTKCGKQTSEQQLAPNQAAVWNGERNFFRYLQQKDLKGFMSIWDENFVGWPDYSERPLKKKDIESGTVEEFQGAQKPGPPIPAPTPEAIGIFGNVAVTHYFWPQADESSPVKYRITHTWQKGAQGWHIIGGMSCEVPRSAAQSNQRQASALNDDKAAIEAVVRDAEAAYQAFDFAKADTFLAPDAKWIERSAPIPAAFGGTVTGFWGEARASKVRLTNEPHDLDIHIQGNVAWVTLFVDVTTVADNEAARVLLARTEAEETGKTSNPTQHEWRATYTESEVLVKTPDGWRIALGHTSRLPAKSN